jgi:phenylpropionate dioxygenase-like ring-hydroxylating dioxygenase large terminal subunit
VRSDDNILRVLLNTCTHRGSLVCRRKSGNAKSFQCPYHAWTFDLRGQLVGVPGEESYGERGRVTNWRSSHLLRSTTIAALFLPPLT